MNEHQKNNILDVGRKGQIDLWKTGAIVFVTGIAAWMIFLFWSPPRLTGGDVTCFKDPGVNLAQGRGLVELVTPANPTLNPRFYSNYPPLFPALYGLYVSFVGVSAKADEVFDFALTAGAAVLFWFFVTPRYSDRQCKVPSLIMAGILVMMLPIGPFWTQRERPDTLGFIIMMASLWVASTGLTPKRTFLAAFIAGIGCLISPYTFVMNGFALGFIIWVEGEPLQSLRRPLTGKFFKLTAAAASGVIVPFLGLFLIQWLNDPEATARFVSNAMGKTTQGRAGTGYLASFLAGDFHTYFGAFSRFNSFRYKWMLAHLIFVVAATTFCLIRTKPAVAASQSRWLPLATLCLAVVPLVIFPYQPCYMSLTAAMALLLFSTLYKHEKQERSCVSWVKLAGVVVIALVAIPYMFREFANAIEARDTFQTAITIIQKASSDPNRPVHLVATKAPYYFLFKKAGFETVEVDYLKQPADMAQVDLFAFNSDGKSIRFPDWWEPDKMETLHLTGKNPDLSLFGINISNLKLFGVKIYQSGASWEPNLYRYKKP